MRGRVHDCGTFVVCVYERKETVTIPWDCLHEGEQVWRNEERVRFGDSPSSVLGVGVSLYIPGFGE